MRLPSLIAASLCLAAPAMAQDAFRWVVQPGFQDAQSAYHGVVPLQQDGLWGLMAASGTWLAEPQFQAIGPAGNGWFPVKKGGKWGIVSETGETVAGFEYDAIGTPAPYTPMQFEGVWYALGPTAEFDATPLPFDTLIGNDGNCMVGTAQGVPVTANRGDAPLDQQYPQFDSMKPPAEGYVDFTIGGKAGHVDCAYGAINGGAADFDQASGYSEGHAAVRVGTGWGYVANYDNAFEFGGDWQGARAFSQGLAPVKQDGRWGYVDLQGSFVIPPQFDQAYAFSDGLAGVEVDGKRGFILPSGRFAIAPQFDDFWRHDGGVVPVRQGELWGVIAPDATDPATRLNLPLAALAAEQSDHQPGFTLQPSNPHYYVTQDVASLHSIFVSDDEKLMITTLAQSDVAEVALWDYSTHRLIRKLPVQWATQAVLLPKTEMLAVGLQTGEMLIVDAVTGAELYRIAPHDSAVLDMVVSPDGQWLASTDGATVQVWQLATGQASRLAVAGYQKIRFTRDSQAIYAGNTKGGLIKLTLAGETLAQVPDTPGPDAEYPPAAALANLALSPDGTLINLRQLAEQQADGYFQPKVWLEIVTESGSRTVELAKDIRDVMSVDISADGRWVAYAGQTDSAYVALTEVRDLSTGAVVFSATQDGSDAARAMGFDRFVYSIDRLQFAPGGGLISIGSEGQDILLLDPLQKRVQASFAAPLASAQAQTAQLDSPRLFSSDGAGTVRVWDLAQGRLEAAISLGDVNLGVEEQIEPDGDQFYLYSGLDDGVVFGFDMASLAPIPLTTDQAAAIYARMDYDQSIPLPEAVQSSINALQNGDPVAPIDRVIPLANGRIAVVSQPVGLHRAYDLNSGALLAEFLATPDGEWLVVTPEGFFAASAKGANLVSVSSGLHAFAVDQAYQALYRPDLVQAKLAGDPNGDVARAAAELDLARIMGSGPAPITRFSLPMDGAKAAEPEIEVQIELQDEGGGIGRVEWRLNGLTVEVQPTRAAVALDEDVPKATARMALDPGQNVIEVVAYNAAGLLASAPRQLTVTWDGVASSEPPALHVLAVGVNDYADGRLQLKYAAADAQAFANAMQKSGAGLFSSVDVVTLLDGDATEAKLDAAFAAMGQRVKSQDVFLFFLAGHGKTVEGKYYFIPQDFRFEGDDPIRAHGIDQDRWQEWAARVKAKKSVMIYDTCESGSITESRSVDAAMAQSAAVERLTRAMGRTILSASTDDAPALEGYQGHGVMTWAMLDAFDRADSNGNATIEVTELASFLDVKVPEISAAAFGFRQVPQMSIKGSDFAMGSRVAVLDAAAESFPATLTHVVAGGTAVLDAPDGAQVQAIPQGVFYGVFKIEEAEGFARIAKDGKALGWVAIAALTPLQ